MVGLLMLGKWATEGLAVWLAGRMAARQGVAFEAPTVCNPFTEDPPTALQKMFYGCLVMSMADEGDLSVDPAATTRFTAWLKASSPGTADAPMRSA